MKVRTGIDTKQEGTSRGAGCWETPIKKQLRPCAENTYLRTMCCLNSASPIIPALFYFRNFNLPVLLIEMRKKPKERVKVLGRCAWSHNHKRAEK